MVFKELEIQGFKSFPDKVKITFDAGVTGVVGPNGSGKSNLSIVCLYLHQANRFQSCRWFQVFTELFSHIRRRFFCKFFYDFWIFQCI